VDLGLKGKRALVTAASKGIGRAVAAGLLDEGCRVAICSSTEANVQGTAEELSGRGEVFAMAADISQPDECADLAEWTLDTLGGLDVLVTNCKGPPTGRFEDFDEATWRHAFDMVFMSAARLSRALLPALRADGGGAIVCLNSFVAKQPADGLVLSNALRPAVAGLAKTLSREGSPEVRVNCIGTGWTVTDRVTGVLGRVAEASGKSLEEVIAERAAGIPLQRMAQPEEIAAAAVFLASDAAGFITGATLDVDGGEIHGLF
jgi:3-oxoacyl-[acyl-carrier protein] reductase